MKRNGISTIRIHALHSLTLKLGLVWLLALMSCQRPLSKGGASNELAPRAGAAPDAATAPKTPNAATAEPIVVVGTPLVRGPSSPQLIRETIGGRYLPDLMRCYRETLATQPMVVGRISLALNIGKDGVVFNTNIESDSAQSQSLEDCVTAVGRGFRFPAPSAQVVTTVPIVFTRSDAMDHE